MFNTAAKLISMYASDADDAIIDEDFDEWPVTSKPYSIVTDNGREFQNCFDDFRALGVFINFRFSPANDE